MTAAQPSPSLSHQSPLVYQCCLGEVEVEGFGKFKNAILLPGQAEPWVWVSPYDSHETALSLDLLERLHASAEVIVLGLGVDCYLKVSSDVLEVAAGWGPNLFLSSSHKAVERYNGLVQEGKAVALAIHTAC